MDNYTIKRKLAAFGVLCGLLWGLLGCSPKMVPVTGSTDTNVHVKDSLVINIKDSTVIHEATRYKDLAWLGDSLKIEGNHSRMWAVADTNKGAIVGGLEEDEVKEKTKIIYKDRWKVRDSIRVEEKPIPVEVPVEVKVIPKFWRVMGILGIIETLLLLVFLFLKIKKILKI